MSVDKEIEAPEVVAWYLSYTLNGGLERVLTADKPPACPRHLAHFYQPLMTVAQHERIMASKDAALIELINSRNAHQWEHERLSEVVAEKDAEIARLEKLAYIGEHQFEDLTWKARCDELRAQLAADKARITSLEDYLPVVWRDGPPPHPWDQEWFIGLLDNDGRVVLKALPEEHSYDFRTADETYYSAFRIKMWAQFPDSEYVSAPAPQLAQQLTVKGCTKPGCFPYCDCGGVDDCTPARSLDRVVMPEPLSEREAAHKCGSHGYAMQHGYKEYERRLLELNPGLRSNG